jgi:hypothetical protein
MKCLPTLFVVFAAAVPAAAVSQGGKPLTPAEAIKKVGEEVTVQMVVKASKNALAKRKEIYLDSEEDFRDAKNLAAVIDADGAAKFREAGVEDPAAHFKGKTVRVRGTVTRVDDRPRIFVSDPKQIRIVEPKN